MAVPNLPPGFDFTDPDIYAQRLPTEELAELRRAAPIWWNEQPPDVSLQSQTHRTLDAQHAIRARQPRRFHRTTDACPVCRWHRIGSTKSSMPALPNQVWTADITYLDTAEGWLYLATVLDLYSRRIVGWAMAEHMETSLVRDALQMALNQRHPAAGLLHHSDRGRQYASAEYQAVLAAHGIECSMSRRGNCYDNAVHESFFGTLKSECADGRFASRTAARQCVFEYIEVWYNRQRRHSTLGYLSPAEFEQVRVVS